MGRAAELITIVAHCGDRSDELAEQIRAAAESATPEREWLALARDVAAARRAESDRQSRRALADELLSLVARVDDETVVDDLRARIESAPSRSVLESRRPEILAAISQAEREAERAFIVAQALEVWSELGYESSADFHEVLSRGNPALLHHDEWPDHALQVRFDATRGHLATNVVALGATTPARDKEVEEDHCADAAEFTAALGSRGVDARLVQLPQLTPVRRTTSP